MAKDTGLQTALGAVAWVLAFVGFVLVLAGVSAMQKNCGNAGTINQVLGTVNYLAPVPCDRFFSFDWFILWFAAFAWLVVGVFLFSRKTHVARPLCTSLMGIACVLLFFMCNTWYRAWSGLGQFASSTFIKDAKVTFAGALIWSIADLTLLMLLGIVGEENEKFVHTKETTPTGGHPIGVSTTSPAETHTTTTAAERV